MTGLVSAATLASARAALERLHVTPATHSRLAETIGSDGSVIQSWTPLGSVQCRIETDMGRQQQARVGGQPPADTLVSEYVVYAAHDADIRTGDRLTLSSGVTLSVARASRGQSQGFVSAFHCTEATS